MTTEPKVERWKPKKVERDGRFFLMLGRHGVGKTSLLAYVCSIIGSRCNDWIGFSPTMGEVETLEDLMPSCYIYSRCPTDEDLGDLIEKQKKERRLGKKYPDYRPRKLGLILDDVGYNKKWVRNAEKLSYIVMNQRHYGILLC